MTIRRIKSRTVVEISTADAELQTRIRIALGRHQYAGDYAVYVAAQHGTAVLLGEVSALSDRRKMLEVAKHVAGVLRVNDELTVVDSSNSPAIRAKTVDRVTKDAVLGARWRTVRQRLAVSAAGITLAILVLAGCGHGDAGRVKTHPVEGAIQYRGQPISGAFVSLHPATAASSDVPNPRATVATDGAFAMSTYDGNDGAPEGEYVLTVQWYKPVRKGADMVGGPNVLPKKYASPRTSDIRVNVAAGENRLPPIQLR